MLANANLVHLSYFSADHLLYMDCAAWSKEWFGSKTASHTFQPSLQRSSAVFVQAWSGLVHWGWCKRRFASYTLRLHPLSTVSASGRLPCFIFFYPQFNDLEFFGLEGIQFRVWEYVPPPPPPRGLGKGMFNLHDHYTWNRMGTTF